MSETVPRLAGPSAGRVAGGGGHPSRQASGHRGVPRRRRGAVASTNRPRLVQKMSLTARGRSRIIWSRPQEVPSEAGNLRGGSNPGAQGYSSSNHQPWRERQGMHMDRSRLLILLVLVSVVAAGSWTTSVAHGKAGSRVDISSPVIVPKPRAAPTSGEPDVGQTPHNASHTGVGCPGLQPGEREKPRRPANLWFYWVSRMWMMRFVGAR